MSRSIAARMAARPGADDGVVADDRPVDVERDEADREDRRMPDDGHVGDHGALDDRDLVGARRGRLDAARPARQAQRDMVDDGRPLVGADLEEGDPAGQPCGQPVEQAIDDRQAVRTAIERERRLVTRVPAGRSSRPNGHTAGWRR